MESEGEERGKTAEEVWSEVVGPAEAQDRKWSDRPSRKVGRRIDGS